MHFGLLLTLLQQPVAPAPPSPIARVEITPAAGELQIGQSLRLTVRALDANGAPVPNAQIRYFVGSDNGHVDSTGVLTAGYAGPLRVVAIAFMTGQTGSVRGEAVFRATPEPPTRVAVDPLPTRVVVGTQLTLVATAYARHGDRRPDMAAFTTSNARVASVGADGQLRALTPGRATITAAVGSVAQRLPLVVVAPPAGRPTLTAAAVRTGDVVRFTTTPRDVAVAWSVGAGSGAAAIDHNGAFVAELPGVYTVRATIGTNTAEAVVRVEARRVTRGIEVRAHLPISQRAAEVWVHPNGQCAYLSTIADRVYAVDIADPTHPRIVDSMMNDARINNDVMTTEDGRYGVFSREGASNRKNGIMIFEASDPCHPKVIAEYTETVSGGVHSSYVYRGHVYLTDDATGSMRVIDIQDPYHPAQVARWQTEQTEAGRYLHDIMVVDGLAYLAYWNDGLVILDVGNGMKGGSPEHPQLVSQFKY